MADYAEAVWNRQIDDCISQLEMGISLTHSIIGELDSMIATCNRLRQVVDHYVGYDRAYVDTVANLLRDAFGRQISEFIRTLSLASDHTYDVQNILNGVQ